MSSKKDYVIPLQDHRKGGITDMRVRASFKRIESTKFEGKTTGAELYAVEVLANVR